MALWKKARGLSCQCHSVAGRQLGLITVYAKDILGTEAKGSIKNRPDARPSHWRGASHPVTGRNGGWHMSTKKTSKHIKLDERNHVEIPLLEQLEGLGWDIIDLTRRIRSPATLSGRTLPKSSCCPVSARAAQGHQSMAGRRSGRRSRQATHR